jgi:hypothetical protein
MKWLDQLLGRTGGKSESKSPVDVPARDEAHVAAMQLKMEEGFAAREKVLATLGALDADVVAPLMNPHFMGGPKWPSLRQSWRVVRRPDTVVVVSDGLSDPFEDEGIPLGFRLEVFAEGRNVSEPVHHTWLFDLAFQVSQLVAQNGRVHEGLQKYGSLSTVMPIVGVPQAMEGNGGKVGILLGLRAEGFPETIDLPDGPIRLVSVQLLWPSELAFIESAVDLASGRDEIVSRLLNTANGHVCSFERPPVA